MNILIAGGSGLIGKQLQSYAENSGHQVRILSRNKFSEQENMYCWDIETEILDIAAINYADVIVNLAGENIGVKRWTKKQKERILTSRVNSTKLLFETIKKSDKKPKVYISASAVGFYGTEISDNIFSEDDNSGNDFLAKTTKRWEEEIESFNELNIRTVKLRLGVVFSEKNGAFQKMAKVVKSGFGAPLGSGKQFVSWVSSVDVCRLILFAIENKNIRGAYNSVADEHLTNSKLTKAIALKYRRRILLPPVPAFFLKLALGEMSVIVLKGSRISNAKIKQTGFEFKHKSLNDFLNSFSIPE